MRRTLSSSGRHGGRHVSASVPSELRVLAQKKLAQLVKEEMVYLQRLYGMTTETASSLILQHLRSRDAGSLSPSSQGSESGCSWEGSVSSDDTDERIDYLSRTHGLTRQDAERVLMLSDELRQPGGIAGLVSGPSLASLMPGSHAALPSSSSAHSPHASSSSSSSASSGAEWALLSQIERLCDKLRLLRPRLASSASVATSDGPRSACTFGSARDRASSRGGPGQGLMFDTPLFGASGPVDGRMSPLEGGEGGEGAEGQAGGPPTAMRAVAYESSGEGLLRAPAATISTLHSLTGTLAGHKRRAPVASTEGSAPGDGEKDDAGAERDSKRRRVSTHEGEGADAKSGADAGTMSSGAVAAPSTSSSCSSSSSSSSASVPAPPPAALAPVAATAVAAGVDGGGAVDLDAEIAAALAMGNE